MNNLEKKIDKLLEERKKYLDMLYKENDWRRGERIKRDIEHLDNCLLYTSPSPRDRTRSRMPSSA